MIYGLIGEKLGHSFSKEIHQSIADYEYNLIEIPRDKLGSFMEKKSFKAINVTIPYKQEVMPYLDYISPRAERIGAVNTIVRKGNKLYGYNTDYYGLRLMLENFGAELKGKSVLIIGAGGAAKTAHCVAEDMGADEIKMVTRSVRHDSISYDEAYAKFNSVRYIINASPCGMYPDNQACPIDIDRFPALEGVFDAIYNPLRSELVMRAREKCITAEGGLYMLVAQAVKACEIFLGKELPEGILKDTYDEVLKSKENIVLTGMPGSGKTAKGRIVAEKLGREFCDIDEIIVKEEGKPISKVFKLYGEEYFRKKEAQVIERLSAQNGIVISTGGGSILRSDNVKNLKKNGRIYFINRPLEDIKPTDDRPLSSNYEALKKRFEERYPLYISTSDVEIKSKGIIDDAMKILERE